MDLCIYLNEEEYKNLEDSMGEINQWIEDIGIPNHKKMYSKCMHWKITSGDKNECKVVKCEQLFYTKEGALLEGVQQSTLHCLTNP